MNIDRKLFIPSDKAYFERRKAFWEGIELAIQAQVGEVDIRNRISLVTIELKFLSKVIGEYRKLIEKYDEEQG